jgi:hypothetical protein
MELGKQTAQKIFSELQISGHQWALFTAKASYICADESRCNLSAGGLTRFGMEEGKYRGINAGVKLSTPPQRHGRGKRLLFSGKIPRS